MGVSGSGKTTVARLLAERLGRPMLEGDDLHSDQAVAKMSAGRALTDADRRPWLRRIRAWIVASAADGAPGVVACSALRRSYRDLLRGADDKAGTRADDEAADGRPGAAATGPAPILFLHLHVGGAELRRRLEVRVGHYMKVQMLGSQLATLEPPSVGEPAITVDATGSPDAIVDELLRRLAEY